MKISLLVHNLNRASILERCLASIAEQRHRPLEVVVLDAGSSDGSQQVIERAAAAMSAAGIEVRVHDVEPMGVAASRNHAAGLASGDLLCFVDNDATFTDPGDVGRAAAHFARNPRLAVLSFRVLQADRDTLDPFAWVFRRPHTDWFDRAFDTFTFAGTGFCVRASDFRAAGGFWDHLRYSREEEELGLALIEGDRELLYSPDVTIRHYADPRGRSSLAERRRVELRNGILVLWRRLPAPLALVLIAARIGSMSLRTLFEEGSSLGRLLAAVPEAAREWRASHLERAPIRFRSAWRYAALHRTGRLLEDQT